MPRLPARYARTIRYTLEREQNRKAAISVGFRPAAHNSKMWNARREPYRVRRRTARIWTCSAGGISSKVVDGTVGAPSTWMCMHIQRITRAPHCANVVWPDLAVYGHSALDP